MITSTRNPKIKDIRRLQARSKARRERKAFVIEGVRLLEEALRHDRTPELIIHTRDLDERGLTLIDSFKERGALIEPVSEQVFQQASDTETPQGILAVIPLPAPERSRPVDFLVVTDQIRDPGNLGTILRSAAAAGVDELLMPPGTVDAFAPKVVRAGMGAHFQLSLASTSWQNISRRIEGLTVFTADAHQGIPCWEADFSQPSALIIGSEAHGPGEQARRLTDTWVHIPMPGRAESLNAGVALAVLLFEVVRQRHYQGQGGKISS